MPEAPRAHEPLVLALPKGRILNLGREALERAGYRLAVAEDARALRHEGGDLTVLVMRGADVPTYVHLGVADAGMVGRDVLLEQGSRLYAPVDLGFGVCRLSLIRPSGATGPIRVVASKYPNVAAEYLQRVGIAAEVVELTGTVELACVTGLADAVVDVVETGATLKANGLVEVEVIARSSVRLVVNRAALKLKAESLRALIASLRTLAAG